MTGAPARWDTEARSIDQVIGRLDQVVRWSRENRNRAGYFAALYRKVTIEVREGIARGIFDDGPRMERLDVIFANRYLDAFARYRAGEQLSRSWLLAFDATGHWWPIVLQHLLLGINAHINLDLGVAAAETSPGAALAGLKRDFDRINATLASMVDEVQTELGQVWPLLRLLDWVGGRTDEQVIHFSIARARDAAWAVARELASASPEQRAGIIGRIDTTITALGRLIRYPGPLAGAVTRMIRLAELRSVPAIIEILE
jgi:hypothetical protein